LKKTYKRTKKRVFFGEISTIMFKQILMISEREKSVLMMRRCLMEFIYNNLFGTTTILGILFLLAITLKKRIFSIFISLIVILLGISFFLYGLNIVKGFGGMGASLVGLIFTGIGLILFLASILVIFLKKEERNLLRT
jgi:hypothetical protein